MNTQPIVLSEIRASGATAQLVEWHWPAPLQTDIRETLHILEMSLPPFATEGLASYPERTPHLEHKMGNLFLRPAGVLLRTRAPGGHIRTVRCVIHPAYFAASTGHEADWDDTELRACLDLRGQAARLLMQRLYTELVTPGLASATLVDAYATALSIETVRMLGRGRHNDDGGRLASWQWRRIEERLAADGPPPSVGELAALCGLSPRHLLRLYRNFAGEPAAAGIERARAAKARQLLTETDLAVKEIAARLGFARPGNFSTAFTRASGLSPRQYRQRHGKIRPSLCKEARGYEQTRGI